MNPPIENNIHMLTAQVCKEHATRPPAALVLAHVTGK